MKTNGPFANTYYEQFDDYFLFDEVVFAFETAAQSAVRAFLLTLSSKASTLELELPIRAHPKAIAPEEQDAFNRRLIVSTKLNTPLTGDPHDDAIRLMEICSDWTASLLICFSTPPDEVTIKVSNDELLQSEWSVTYKATFEWTDDLDDSLQPGDIEAFNAHFASNDSLLGQQPDDFDV